MEQSKITVNIYEGKPATAGDMKLILDDGREIYFNNAELCFESDSVAYIRGEFPIEGIKVIKANK